MTTHPHSALYCLDDVVDALSDAARDTLHACLSRKEYKRGDVLYWRNSARARTWFIASGEVSVWREEQDGEQELLRFAGPGDVLSPEGFLAHSPYARSLLAEEDSIVFELTKEGFCLLTALDARTASDVLSMLGLLALDHPDSVAPEVEPSWLDRTANWR